MPYYLPQGDYYAPRGDPFLGVGAILGGVARLGRAALPRVGGLVGRVFRRGARTPPIAVPPAITRVARGRVARGAAAAAGAGAAFEVGARMVRGRGPEGRPRRRMNVANVRALRRAIRRVQGFTKLARRTIQLERRARLKRRRR